jgi:formylglycine-generating enzyme required for sulfatase activity
MKALRWLVITLGTLVLTTLGINAFDNIDNPKDSLLGAAFRAYSGGGCDDGMVFVGSSNGGFCVDAYEASTGEDCQYRDPQSRSESGDNLSLSACEPVSEPKQIPWRNITREQAALACARVEKRLPSSEEWYRAALGTPDKSQGWTKSDCNVADTDASTPDKTGVQEQCVSPAGAFDMIGNVWEWVDGTVINGTLSGTTFPGEGYITGFDSRGFPYATNPDAPNPEFFDDYFWLDPTDARGILRGGYWKSKADAGQYSVNITVTPTFVGGAIGFRCVKDLPRE